MTPRIGEVYHWETDEYDAMNHAYGFYLKITAVWGDFVSYLKEDGRRQDMDLRLFCKYIRWRQILKITDTVFIAKLCLLGVIQ
jgi:hypothetical protein